VEDGHLQLREIGVGQIAKPAEDDNLPLWETGVGQIARLTEDSKIHAGSDNL
jgi:hypothetical protein